jgi:F-type H+-transporting ATPase subunit gamma
MTGKNKVEFVDANEVTTFILDKFEAGEYDKCHLAYNSFVSVLSQKPTMQQIIPFDIEAAVASDNVGNDNAKAEEKKEAGPVSPYAFEPEEEKILSALLPRNIGVQIYSAMLDSAAGEHAARMTAMDNATRNAGEMINDLSLQYNRARQAHITKELIEIISGAEAL